LRFNWFLPTSAARLLRLDGASHAQNHLEMVEPRLVILSPIAVPRAVKAPTTAMATRAAATAYSESSRPVSSSKNFFIFVILIFIALMLCFRATLVGKNPGAPYPNWMMAKARRAVSAHLNYL